MAVNIEQDVLRLYISKHDVLFVQVLKRQQELCEVKLGIVLRESEDSSKVEKHFAASADVEHEEKFFFALETPVKLDDEGVVNLLEDASLVEHRLDLFVAYHLFLFHYFHGIQSARVLFTYQHHSAEGTSAYYLYLLEIVSRRLGVKLLVLCEVEFCKVCSQEFAILKHADRPIVLRQPIIKCLPSIACFECDNDLLLEFDVLVNKTNPLLPGLPPILVDFAERLGVHFLDLHCLLSLHSFFIYSLLKQYFVVFPSHL